MDIPGVGPLKISQIAVVARNLEKTIATYHELLGWGPWNVYEHAPPTLHHTHLHGEPVEYTMLGAETDVHGIVFEVVQPLDGPSIYKEWLEEHGEGVQHVACMMHTADESEAFKRRFADADMRVLMGGRIGETIEFFYLDTQPALKFILESGSGHAIDMSPSWTYP